MLFYPEFVNRTQADYVPIGAAVQDNSTMASPTTAPQPSHHEFIVVDPTAPPDPRPFLIYRGPDVTPSRAWQEDPYRARRAPFVRQQDSIGEAQPPSTFSTFQVKLESSSNMTMASPPDIHLPLGPISEIQDALTSPLSEYTLRRPSIPLKRCRFLAPPMNYTHRCRASRPALLSPVASWSTERRYAPNAMPTSSRNRQPWLSNGEWPAGVSRTPRPRASGERGRWSSFFVWDFDAAMAALEFNHMEQSDEEEDADERKPMEWSNDLDAGAQYFGALFSGRRLPTPTSRWAAPGSGYHRVRVSSNALLRDINPFYKPAPPQWYYPEDARHEEEVTAASSSATSITAATRRQRFNR
ncbi:hypothetical protein HYPSUDRAFT_47572 [Hypholoma sublateritium FD-334 SS-4]|uniref:Uncharacterized protein n=1 Tax=Hypholoma sublateritium (strain FD-334 SS-4) TaxID=945553 RepID=A0A0D2NAT0_HYPSF|nr:hypothetical protein HYPSUDRAFT_47572 [Hypholoma sublateritium FD-334 SS-4]